MNEHQKTADYILGKMAEVNIPGAESELHTLAKRWLVLIKEGQFNVQETNLSAADGEPAGGSASNQAAAEAKADDAVAAKPEAK